MRYFTVVKSNGKSTANEKTVTVQTLERYLTESLDKKMGNFFDTVEERI